MHYLGKQIKKKTASYRPPNSLPFPPHPRGLREAWPCLPLQPRLSPPRRPLPCSGGFPKNSPSLGSQPLLLWYPPPAMPFPSFLPVNSSPWLQALGQRLLTHKGLLGPGSGPPRALHPLHFASSRGQVACFVPSTNLSRAFQTPGLGRDT